MAPAPLAARPARLGARVHGAMRRARRRGPAITAALLVAAASASAARRCGARPSHLTPWHQAVGSDRLFCRHDDHHGCLPSRVFLFRDEPARREDGSKGPALDEPPELLSSGSDGVGIWAILQRGHTGAAAAWRPQREDSSNAADLAYKIVLGVCFILATAGSASLLVYAVMSGLLLPTSGGGLRPCTMIEHMEAVRYDSSLFADPADEGDQRPTAECCCCSEEYTAGTSIMRTPCSHYFHRECLARWLAVQHTCPLCRSDLEAAVAKSPFAADIL